MKFWVWCLRYNINLQHLVFRYKNINLFMFGGNDISYMTIIHFIQKVLRSAESFLISTYGFAQCHIIRVTVCLYSLTVIMQFIMYIKKLLCKNCLFVSNLQLTQSSLCFISLTVVIRVQFSNATFSGSESSGVVYVALSLEGGTLPFAITVTVVTSEQSAEGKRCTLFVEKLNS